MGRLAIAILILLAALVGVRLISSPSFRQFIANQIGGAPPTQTTGFNSSVPTNISNNTPLSPNAPPSTGTSPGDGSDSGSNNAPTQPLTPIPAGW